MTYFPFLIRHIDDVLQHIAGRTDFVVAARDGYTVIDYLFAGPDTFDHPARVECRGLKFGPDGAIIARPFQKFFNIGERPETVAESLDFSASHLVMEKLDGSMIHAAIVHDEVVFMTRMGRTDVAMACEAMHLTDNVREACRDALRFGWTPIFEWTAPQNRIVIAYPKSTLTLLAMRGNWRGEYLDAIGLKGFADHCGVPAVASPDMSWDRAADFAAFTRAIRGAEGFVVRFADGQMVKAKAEEYVLKHKAKDSVLQEKNVLALYLRGELDDVLPLLDAPDRERVERYAADVRTGISDTERVVEALVEGGAHLDQKTFATSHMEGLAQWVRGLAFNVRSGAGARQAIEQAILKSVGSATAVDGIRHMLGGASFAANDNASLVEAA